MEWGRAAKTQGGEALRMLSLAVQAKIPYSTLRHLNIRLSDLPRRRSEAIGAYGGTMKVIDPAFEPLILD